MRRANAAAALSKAISNDRRSRSGKAYVMTTDNTLVFIDGRFVTRKGSPGPQLDRRLWALRQASKMCCQVHMIQLISFSMIVRQLAKEPDRRKALAPGMIETDADAEKSAAERVTTPVVGSKAHQNPNMDCCNRKAHDMMARGWIFCAAYYIPRDLPREK